MERIDCVLAIDPGTVKCGLAVVHRDEPQPRFCCIVPVGAWALEASALVATFAPQQILLGSGTASKAFAELLGPCGVPVEIVNEYGSTLAARARYFVAHPPRGWRRFLPAGLRVPPVPIDDWAAVVLAERFFAASAGM